jgi:hypothetical protein
MEREAGSILPPIGNIAPTRDRPFDQLYPEQKLGQDKPDAL